MKRASARSPTRSAVRSPDIRAHLSRHAAEVDAVGVVGVVAPATDVVTPCSLFFRHAPLPYT
eukprot:3171341-Pleurochrysis_carterae.AAC.1